MNTSSANTSFLRGATIYPGVFLLAGVASLLVHHEATAAVSAVNLGTASGFAVLAGAGITNTGATMIAGDVGTFPTLSATGFETVTMLGTNHGGDAVTQLAKGALGSAYIDAAGRVATVLYGPEFQLGGLTLGPGIYNGSTSFGITGILTLDAGGDPGAVWIFQAGSTLTTASDSLLVLLGGASASNIFWQVGSSATLGTGSNFVGTILAFESITLNTGATLDGRALALNGAVTMDSNNLAVPEPSGAMLFSCGLGAMAVLRRRSRAGSRGSAKGAAFPLVPQSISNPKVV